jgi:hypothetical protein
MVEVKQLELNLWAVLQEANAAPEEAEFPPIWQALDQVLPELGIVAQLQMAAATIAQVADIFQVQAGLIFEELDATATNEGPRMAADAFDRYVRQYMAIEFEDYIEEPAALPRMPRSVKVAAEEFYSVVESVAKAELLEVLHDEIGMTEAEAHAAALLVLVQLPLIELWLGLLLGGYGMRREVEEFERDEDFYSAIGIVVMPI